MDDRIGKRAKLTDAPGTKRTAFSGDPLVDVPIMVNGMRSKHEGTRLAHTREFVNFASGGKENLEFALAHIEKSFLQQTSARPKAFGTAPILPQAGSAHGHASLLLIRTNLEEPASAAFYMAELARFAASKPDNSKAVLEIIAREARTAGIAVSHPLFP